MHVPKNCEIALENTGGDSEIKGIVGNLTIHAFSGDVEVEDTMAETMRITADSGDVSLDNVSGHKAIIESLSGSVEGDIKFLECLMNLSSGDALLDVGEGDYTIEAASGNIEISPSGPYNLDAACSVGEITVAGEEKGQEYRISQENSKITLRLRADSGDIELD